MTRSEMRHMDRVRELGCIACRIEGLGASLAEIHHPLKNGRRMGHKFVLPLCAQHHRSGRNDAEIVSRHPWKSRFEARYGTEQNLLEQTERELKEAA